MEKVCLKCRNLKLVPAKGLWLCDKKKVPANFCLTTCPSQKEIQERRN